MPRITVIGVQSGTFRPALKYLNVAGESSLVE
jgi:hypothetical protein